MASTLKNDYANGIKQAPAPFGSETISHRFEYSLSAALVVNDILVLGYLPAGSQVVDAILDSDDLDSNGAPAVVLGAGILNTGLTDIDTTKSGGTAWITGSTIGQAGTAIARPTTKAITRTPVDNTNNLPFGVKVETAPATSATSGKVGLTVVYRAAAYNG